MKHSVKWWVSLLACAAVFWAGLICLVMSLDSGDADRTAELRIYGKRAWLAAGMAGGCAFLRPSACPGQRPPRRQQLF